MRRPPRRGGEPALLGLVALIVLGLTAFYVAVPAFRVRQATHVPAAARLVPPEPPDGYRNVSFRTSDGLTLRGWYRPPANGAVVILVHGYGLTRSFLLPQANALAGGGFGVLTFDLRGHGASDGDRTYRGWREADDVAAAVQHVLDRPDPSGVRVGLYGFSIGGQAVLRAAARTPEVRAVMADGPVAGSFADEPVPATASDWLNYPARWVYYALFPLMSGTAAPPSLREEVARIAPRPVLLVASGTGYELRQERRLLEAAGAPKQLYEIPETWHGGGSTSRPQEFGRVMTDFFRSGLAAVAP